MEKVPIELKEVKTSNQKYFYMLIYFTIISYCFVSENVPILYLAIFIAGLIIITIVFERLERELAMVKMKNFYIKSKLSLKVEELENMINNNQENISLKLINNLLEEIEV
ncbi:MAG: hypothetical protein OQJ81_04120 [Melioribacteraceae bacterium]|nr:hypothetical protein [Melioribacteraceae bacterium]